MKDNYKILKATVELSYYIPMIDDEKSAINGWTIDQIVKDWFRSQRGGVISSFHATRDAHLIGNSDKLLHFTVKEEV